MKAAISLLQKWKAVYNNSVTELENAIEKYSEDGKATIEFTTRANKLIKEYNEQGKEIDEALKLISNNYKPNLIKG